MAAFIFVEAILKIEKLASQICNRGRVRRSKEQPALHHSFEIQDA
jgi:hypothetical protein